MADVFQKSKRSEIMRRIRSVDTRPEIRVRKKLHQLGFRYRLHDARLPGKPDVVMRRHRAVVQIRGCFWHFHTCSAGRLPRSNKEYWETKLNKNRNRDIRNDIELERLGWRVFIVWECEVQSERELTNTIEMLGKDLLSNN